MNKKLKINHYYNYNNEILFWKVYKNKFLVNQIWQHIRIFNNVYYLTKYIYFDQDAIFQYPYWAYMTSVTLSGEYEYSLNELLSPFITRLSLKNYYNSSGDTSIPETVNNLTFMDSKLPFSLTIPKSVVRLVFGGRFNQIIPEGYIKHGVKYLKFCFCFNQEIQKNVIPSSVTQIQFGNQWNKHLEFGINLPIGLKTLILGSAFNGTIYGEIPQSLESIHFSTENFNQIISNNQHLFNKTYPNLNIYFDGELFKSINVFTLFNHDGEINQLDQSLLCEIKKFIIASPIKKLPLLPNTVNELVIMSDIEQFDTPIQSNIEKLVFYSKENMNFCFFKKNLNNNNNHMTILPNNLTSLDLGFQIPLPNKLPSNLKELCFDPFFNDIDNGGSSVDNLSNLPLSIETLKNNSFNKFYTISSKVLNKFKNLKHLIGFNIEFDENENENNNENDFNIESYSIYSLLNIKELNNLIMIGKNLKSLKIISNYNIELLSRIGNFCKKLENLKINLMINDEVGGDNTDYEYNDDNNEYYDNEDQTLSILLRSIPKSINHLTLFCDQYPDSQIKYKDISESNLKNIEIILDNPWSKPIPIINVDYKSLYNLIFRTNCI